MTGKDLLRAIIIAVVAAVGIVFVPLLFVLGTILIPMILPLAVPIGIFILIGMFIAKGGEDKEEK